MLAVQVEESTGADSDISDVECRSEQKQVAVVRLRYCDDDQQRRGDRYITEVDWAFMGNQKMVQCKA
jgi:hypothetical protein